MSNLYKKIKSHGVNDSLHIIKDKLNLYKELIYLKAGCYNFSNEFKLLQDASNKIKLFINNQSVNSKIDLDNESNDPGLNNFYLLGNNYTFKDDINWHFNSDNVGKSYPFVFEKKIDIYNYKKFGDYRITWELNRHHFFVWYAQQYYLTGEKKYKDKFINELNAWIIQNKPGYGINFVSSMELAIRLINWVTALLIFQKSKNGIELNVNKIIISILEQALYLNNNLTINKRKLRNNHSIVELSGLILIQSILKWKKLLSLNDLYENLFKELEVQFYSDGINFEQSPTYSRFTLESLLIVLILTDRNSDHYNKLYHLTEKYIAALRKFVTPNNSVPLFSDCDNGRILFLSGTNKDFMSFKGFFDFCGIYFNDDSLFVPRIGNDFDYETKWWCFIANLKINYPKIIVNDACRENLFPESGYYIYKTDDLYFAFKSGYLGNKNLGIEYAPHIHNDLLSFELFFNGDPILIDSGTYTYNLFDDGYREYFRSIYAHNTIIVNRKNQFEYVGAFGARNIPKVKISLENEKCIVGEIIFNKFLCIKRKINISKNKIEFSDTVEGVSSESGIEINLNFHPSIKVDFIDKQNKATGLKTGGKKYLLKIETNDRNKVEIINEKGWVSNYYNCKDINEKLIFSFPKVKNNIKVNWSLEKI